MAKPDTMPSKDVIDGFKGTLDFYYWKGIPVARSWPAFKPYKFSPAQLANQAAFSYVNKLWASLDISIKVALSLVVAQTTLTAKDYYVRSYMKGAFALMPPEYYATEQTQLLVLAELENALKTGDLNIEDITKYLAVTVEGSVLPEDAATEAKLVEIDTRLDAIQITKGTLAKTSRSAVLATGIGWTTVLDISQKGLLEALDFASDYLDTDLRLSIDGQTLNMPTPTGATGQIPRPSRLNAYGGKTAWWEEINYDAPGNEFSFRLTRSIEYNSALKVEIRQQSGVNKNVAVILWRRPIT